jgi:hypothetical protein
MALLALGSATDWALLVNGVLAWVQPAGPRLPDSDAYHSQWCPQGFIRVSLPFPVLFRRTIRRLGIHRTE